MSPPPGGSAFPAEARRLAPNIPIDVTMVSCNSGYTTGSLRRTPMALNRVFTDPAGRGSDGSGSGESGAGPVGADGLPDPQGTLHPADRGVAEAGAPGGRAAGGWVGGVAR